MIKDLLENFRNKELFDNEVDLFTLKECQSEKWNYSLPTLIGKKNIKPNLENEDLRKSVHNYVQDFLDLDYSNILIAGGFVSNFLLGNLNFNSDIDIFIYGLNENEVNDRLKKLMEQIIDNCTKEYYSISRIQRTELVTTLIFRRKHYRECPSSDLLKIKFQIMHRLYKTKSEILHGFDLGSSAVGYDGKNIYLTSLSKFCYQNLVNIVDCSRRSTTYEKRLVKYYNRGFDIILPKLDISELENENWVLYKKTSEIKLHNLIINYEFIDGNKIFVNFLKVEKDIYSDYDEYINQYIETTTYQSINNILNGKNIIFNGYKKADIENVIKGVMSPFVFNSIQTCYDKLYKNIQSKKNFPTFRAEQCLSNDIIEIFKNRKNEEYLLKIFKENIDKINKYYSTEFHPIEWKIDNPGTQISGSFNPIIEDESLWYLDYYKHDFIIV